MKFVIRIWGTLSLKLISFSRLCENESNLDWINFLSNLVVRLKTKNCLLMPEPHSEISWSSTTAFVSWKSVNVYVCLLKTVAFLIKSNEGT